MSMRQQHRVNLVRRYWQRRPVAQAQKLVSLKQAAVEQQAFAIVTNQVLRAGNGARSAQKSDVDAHRIDFRFLAAMIRLCTKKCHAGIFIPRGIVRRQLSRNEVFSFLAEETLEPIGPTVAAGQMLAAALFQRFVELTQQFPLVFTQLDRRLDRYVAIQITGVA